MAHIDRRDGRKRPYRVNWTDRFTGKRRNKSFAKRKQAQAFLETLGSDDNLVTQSDPNVTVESALKRWYSLCRTTGRDGRPPVEQSTHKKYDLHRRIIVSLIGSKKLSEMTKRDCNDLRDKLLEQYSRVYAKKILTSFKSALKQAVSDEVIPRSPATDTKILISTRQSKADKITIPTLREIQAITDTIDRLMKDDNGQRREAWARYGAFFYLMLYSGMRPSELRGLAWASVDWNNSRISVERRADNFGELGSPKSAAAYRTIPIASIALEKLEHWRKRCPESEYDLVFPNYKGNIESLSNITNRGWYVLCAEAGLRYEDETGKMRPKYNLYSIRHTKASLEIALNRSPKRIQTLMGHSNIKITFDTYGHLFEDESLQDDPNDLNEFIQMNVQRTSKKYQGTEIID